MNSVRLGIIGMGNMGRFHADYLLAGKVPPPPSWARFGDDLQGAQELATRGGARAGAGRGGEGGEEGAGEEGAEEEGAGEEGAAEAPPLRPRAPLKLETARSILSSGSILSPFSAAASSTASPLLSSDNSSG